MTFKPKSDWRTASSIQGREPMSQLADALQPTLSRAQAPPIFSRGSAWGLREEAGVQELKFSGTRSVSRDVCDDQHSIRVFFPIRGIRRGEVPHITNYLSSSCRFCFTVESTRVSIEKRKRSVCGPRGRLERDSIFCVKLVGWHGLTRG
jgi:hypothetical protein